ncbi:MAG: PD40 domain-containing protein [Planctomycetes bacterium]|nr:PD40 domain-containing protein [Planctomycetota bacterium]
MEKLGSVVVCISFSILVANVTLAQTTTRVSAAPGGVDGNADCQREYVSTSADGRFVAFVSNASNLDPRDTNNFADVFVHDRQTGLTELDSVNPDGSAASQGGGAADAVISASGRWVAFGSAASTPVPGDTNGRSDVFVFDRETRTTRIISLGASGNIGDGNSSAPSISGDGRFVAFASSATNLVPGDTNGAYDVFVRDRDSDGNGVFDEIGAVTTVRASVSSAGTEGNGNSFDPWISADGRVVVWNSLASTLDTPDMNGSYDVFARDLRSGVTSLVSVAVGGGAAGSNSTLSESSSPISAAGRWVTFSSGATNLLPEDSNGATDVFVRDRQSGQTTRASVDSANVPGNGYSVGAVISAAGRFVAFTSGSTNLVAGDTNSVADLFVHDRVSGVTVRTNVSTLGAQADGGVFDAAFSEDGRVLAFTSNATNLVPGDANSRTDVFARDWLPIVIDSVVPASGSEAGGDLVHVFGHAISSPVDVRFGGLPATILNVTETAIDVRTPPGSGVVDVTASVGTTSTTATLAYAYVAPELSARYGTVGVGQGDRETVLLVNGIGGDPLTREIVVHSRIEISVVMASPSSRSSARFAVFAWPGASDPTTIRVQPRGVGTMSFPTTLDVGTPQPIAIGNNLDPRIGVATIPTSPTPSLVARLPRGIRRPTTVTLQGFIQDSAAASSARVSVTNAMVVRVVP